MSKICEIVMIPELMLSSEVRNNVRLSALRDDTDLLKYLVYIAPGEEREVTVNDGQSAEVLGMVVEV